jgi:hypothetical protein
MRETTEKPDGIITISLSAICDSSIAWYEGIIDVQVDHSPYEKCSYGTSEREGLEFIQDNMDKRYILCIVVNTEKIDRGSIPDISAPCTGKEKSIGPSFLPGAGE